MPQIPDPTSDPIEECHDCGRAFSSRYGRRLPIAGVVRWLCHFCADARRDRPAHMRSV